MCNSYCGKARKIPELEPRPFFLSAQHVAYAGLLAYGEERFFLRIVALDFPGITCFAFAGYPRYCAAYTVIKPCEWEIDSDRL